MKKNLDQYKLQYGNVKWNEIFENEQDLLDSLKGVQFKQYQQDAKSFLYSLQGYLKKGYTLSDNQMKQLKRVCKHIALYYMDQEERSTRFDHLKGL